MGHPWWCPCAQGSSHSTPVLCFCFLTLEYPSLEETKLTKGLSQQTNLNSSIRKFSKHVLCLSLTQWGYLSSPLEVPCGVHHIRSQVEAVMHCCLFSGVDHASLFLCFVAFWMVCLRSQTWFCCAWDESPGLLCCPVLDHWAVHSVCEQELSTHEEKHMYFLCFCHVVVFYFSRMEDLTNPEDIRTNVKCDRRVSLYGYLRGAYLKNNSQIHMPGIVCCKALLEHWTRQNLIVEFLKITQLCIICQKCWLKAVLTR